MIYLDHAATTPMLTEVIELLLISMRDDFANPSSSHKLGKDLQVKIKSIKEYILKDLGASVKDHFYFTSSATESNNTVIRGINFKAGDVIIYSQADHKSIVAPIESLKDKGINILSVNYLDECQLSQVPANDQVKLIALSLVNNQSGSIIDFKLIKDLKTKFPKAHIHIDAVQAYKKIALKLIPEIDSLSITAHKIGGPKGIAGLYLKNGHKISPLMYGGGQQEDFRSSTEPYPMYLAFKKTIELNNVDYETKFKSVTELSLKLQEGLQSFIPEIIFPFKNVSPYIVCCIIPKVSSDILIRHLESQNIYIASTSACSSKIKGYNSTMAGLGIAEKYHKNVLRISLSKDTTAQELDEFMACFQSVWNDISYLIK